MSEDLNFENSELENQRDFLLPLLMNGQIKIRDEEQWLTLILNLLGQNTDLLGKIFISNALTISIRDKDINLKYWKNY